MEEPLYKLLAEITRLHDAIEQNEGEITEEQDKRLDELGHMLVNKTDDCVRYHQYLTDRLEMAKKHAAEITQVVKSYENKLKGYQFYIDQCMGRLEEDKLTGERYEIKYRKPQKSVKITNADAVPAEFLKIHQPEVQINLVKLKKALKEKAVSGAQLVDGKRSLIFSYRKD